MDGAWGVVAMATGGALATTTGVEGIRLTTGAAACTCTPVVDPDILEKVVACATGGEIRTEDVEYVIGLEL